MRRAKLEGGQLGRKPLVVDRASIFRRHIHGHSLKDISRTFHISRTFGRAHHPREEEAYKRGRADTPGRD